mmetsp:Transcript_3951/g.7623  ORF Transcript_3951/g.7623 Transcript_3951/m.7623 type:complete len:313 (-) Transcript_3951:321-1259(-)
MGKKRDRLESGPRVLGLSGNGDELEVSGLRSGGIERWERRVGRSGLGSSIAAGLCGVLVAVWLVSRMVGWGLPVWASTAATSSLASGRSLDALYSGLTASFFLILGSELGDKTFFISALLALKYARGLVLMGTMGALGLMTVISVAIGQIFHALPSSLHSSIPFDDYAAVALLVWFGITNIRDSVTLSDDDDEELEGAKEAIKGAEVETKDESRGWIQSIFSSPAFKVVAETFSLVFFAEWGDKSMLATVALAAAKSPVGVVIGGISGHLAASIIAVVGGSILGKYISEKKARLLGGILFLIFAILTMFGVY